MFRLKASFFLVFPLLFGLLLPAPTEIVTAIAVITEVNALRASYGLEPYQVDAGLMAYAQEHAEYMASLRQGTHTHSDGVVPWDIGLQENVASGTRSIMSAYFIVHQIWTDASHRQTLLGYATGFIGVGVASVGGEDWISLDIRPGKKIGVATPEKPFTAVFTAAPGAAIPLVPVRTCTPQSDGLVYHIIGYGQTLWSISEAYGVSIERLIILNGFKDEKATIYAGQKLLIQIAPVTQSGTVSGQQTSTPTVGSTPETITVTPTTVQITPTPQPPASMTETPGISGPDETAERLALPLILATLILAVVILIFYVVFKKQNW